MTLPAIKKEIFASQALNRLAVALGQPIEGAINNTEVTKYASSVLAEIERTAGDSKKDLTSCTPSSIVQAMIDSAQIRLPIDGRQFAHLVKYGNNVSFQVGYRGFLAKLKEFYPDMTPTIEPVWEGDQFSLNDESGYQTYKHVKSNPFETDIKKLKGVICCLMWTDNGNKHSKVTVLPTSEIQKIKSKAKQSFIWDEWYIEKAKVAAIKRACKVYFSTLSGLKEIIDYDNKTNYSLKSSPDMGQGSSNIIDNLNAQIMPQTIDAESTEISQEIEVDDE